MPRFRERVLPRNDEQLRPTLAESFATIVHEATGSKVSQTGTLVIFRYRMFPKTLWVDSIERYWNRRQRIERLGSAWNQEPNGGGEHVGKLDDPVIAAAAEPKRRTRTWLADEEVDAMRTARANGVSVTVLAKQFDVHRGTVWAKTRGR